MERTQDRDRALAKLAAEAAAKLEQLGPRGYALISCSKKKNTHRDLARHMYASPLFRKSILVAECLKLSFSILSAKFGLLEPDTPIEPYDTTLKGKSKQYKVEWGEKVLDQIRQSIALEKTLIVLAGDDYLSPISSGLEAEGRSLYLPMKGLSLGQRLSFLNYILRLEKRRDAVRTGYDLFARIAGRIGFHSLREIMDSPLPSHGVYFFFDENEPTSFSKSLPRLVRIGTHGVSAGSTATLRNRLRTHLGTRTGQGNHRASVFRLHVGRALIERDNLKDAYPNWGKGQSAPREITDKEAPLEARVSQYLANLRVIYVPIVDAAGINSMRATIERQFIAMFSEGFCPLERSSETWLGRSSDRESIRELGLWNVREIGGIYNLRFVELFENIVRKCWPDVAYSGN